MPSAAGCGRTNVGANGEPCSAPPPLPLLLGLPPAGLLGETRRLPATWPTMGGSSLAAATRPLSCAAAGLLTSPASAAPGAGLLLRPKGLAVPDAVECNLDS